MAKILIAGANGGIAQALGAELASRGHVLFSVSRGVKPAWSELHFKADLSLGKSVESLTSWLSGLDQPPEVVIQCSGLLHNTESRPEKRLSQMSERWLHQNLSANVVAHMHLAQAISPWVSRRNRVHWVSLSAMVGSIEDNQLGGWYSYRMTKAALNMLIRNLHIEWTRKSPESIVIALHPGTTDTSLSEPFQANIADDKLYSSELTGRRLSGVIETLSSEQSGHLLHWDGSILPF